MLVPGVQFFETEDIQGRFERDMEVGGKDRG